MPTTLPSKTCPPTKTLLPTRTLKGPDLFIVLVILIALASIAIEIVDPAPMDATAAAMLSP